ncbi:MAG: PAS domain-containing hybrid sensor histidine kinase/response regulator [Nitrospirota bacterium]
MGNSDSHGKDLISLLNKVIDKLIKVKFCHLLWMSVLSAVVITEIIVSISSIAFHGRVTNDYLITGAVAALLVSFVVVFVLLSIFKRLRETDEALKKSHESFVSIMDSLDAIVYVADMETYEMLFVNKYSRDIWGDVVGKTCWKTLQSGQSGPCNFCTNKYLLTPDGKPAGVYNWEFQNTITGRWYEIRDRAMQWIDGRTVRLEIAMDITKRKQSEAERNRLLNVLEASLNEIYMFDPDTLRFKYVNAGAVRNLGYSMDELKEMTPLDLKPEFNEGSFRDLIAPLLKYEKEKVIFQTVHRRADGSLYPVDVHLQRIGYDGEKVFLAVILDITERKKTEEFMRGILESVGEGFLVIDPAYRIILANKSYCERTKMSLEEIKGRCCYEVSHRIDKPCFEAGETCAPRHTFETGEACTALHTHYDRDGNPIYVETRSFPMNDALGNVIAVIEIVDDITEKKRLEDQLRESQKMEAIGKLAGGIAHDFNNILTAIMGYGSLLQADIGKDSRLISRLEHILSSAGKAADLTRQLLAFSRKQIMSPKSVNLNDIIRDLEKLLTRLVSEDVEIKIMLSEKDLTIMADSGQMGQVVMNLATNARDAMPHGGQLTITTEIFRMAPGFIKEKGFGKRGRYACISVADTGEGLDERTKERIFEPFFTTKEVGKGTGLGLAVVYGIVSQHNGYIDVQSELGRGTTFKIYLPLTEKEIEEAEPIISGPVGGTEMILLAEDDEIVRRLVKETLEGFGYRVIEAVDGEDAIAKFMEDKDEIRLLLFDVVMPKKSGKDAYENIKKIKPDVKVVFISGYTADIVHKKGIFEEKIPFLFKPVSPDEILRKTREVLDRK